MFNHLKQVNQNKEYMCMQMGKIDLGTFTSSTKFGGSVIDSIPVRDTRIQRPNTSMFSQKISTLHNSQKYQRF